MAANSRRVIVGSIVFPRQQVENIDSAEWPLWLVVVHGFSGGVCGGVIGQRSSDAVDEKNRKVFAALAH